MNKILTILICFSVSLLHAQEQVQLTAKMTDCGNEIEVFEFRGVGLMPIQKTTIDTEGKYEISLATEGPKMIYVGKAPNKVVPVMIGPEKAFEISGSCKTPKRAKISGSAFNGAYISLKNQVNRMKRDNNLLMTRIVRGKSQEDKDKATAELKVLDEKKVKLLDSLRQASPYLAKYLALNTYLSFAHNQGNYNNELEYFGNEFFSFADFKDESYNGLPLVFDAFYEYTNTLLSVRVPKNVVSQFLDRYLMMIPAESTGTRQNALGGIIRSMEKNKSDLYAKYAKLFINENKVSSPRMAASVQQKLAQLTQFEVGRVAPDFTQQTIEGEDFKLSDLRGKYVLIDFWASWCGPCRRENPNVVRMYKQYHEKGFEILGVSLDRSKDRWVQAIEKDGLTWPHVSDLKGWSNAVAKQYGITSIPKTMLIGPEGKIVAKNLRGPSLEAKLVELFGAPKKP